MGYRLPKTCLAAMAAVMAFQAIPLAAQTTPIPPRFDSAGEDRAAIQALLNTYTRAVSTKDAALFETLLLNRSIPFSDTRSAVAAHGAVDGTAHYPSFRDGVFGGAPFTQVFKQVRIEQDGPLASVTLVFVNSSARGSSWGWKAMQLLKVDGRWKIASEFYTGHS